MDPVAHILVVDDEPGILESLRKIFEREAYHVSVTDSGEEALNSVRAGRVDLVLADIMMPKMSGIELLRAVKALSPATEVVMMTAFGTVENAVECMREGAYDFITKPLKRAIVVRSVQRALERRELLHENRILRRAMGATAGDVVGQSLALRHMLDVVAQAAPSAATLLLVGESGTGKELLARHIHRLSDRVEAPFVAVNCAALPETLLETELFGHEKGAFTGAAARREGRFERAHGGTIFLDEIGETSAAVQVRLLRVLQEGEIERVGGQEVVRVDARVVAATNRNLEEDVRAGRFREDLYYRLNVIQIRLPPLRERRGDVPLLAQHFLGRFCEKNHKALRGFSEAAIKALDAYGWPGNVRELENTIERAVVLSRSDIVGVEDLPEVIAAATTGKASAEAGGFFIPFGTPLEEIERRAIRETLERTGGDKKTAARLLGIAARTIYRKLDGL
ncbi:MAG TPA: sigma-54 dependent transcriptional regulator [Myxococcota bacterium]|nr:sigma-54 dependent transcriptional regulator [Myxococcota bacterium]